jgi:hypothetical protein
MWQYVKHFLDNINPAGINIIRVFIQKDSVDECFFLRYKNLPDDSIIIEHANIVIQIKNDYEQQQQGGLE